MPHPRNVRLLLVKAEQDEYVLDKLLDDANAPEEIFGFHAQQAAEKFLKAILSASGIDYPRIHRLEALMDIIRERGVDLPEEFEELKFLTPFAVEFRYDIFPGDPEEPINKVQVRGQIKKLRDWVEFFIKDKLEKESD